jgi:uncharacterized protein HemX
VDIALKILEILGNVFSAVRIAGGGPIYWAAAIFFCLLAFAVGVGLQKLRNKKAWEESQQQAGQEQSGGKIDNNNAENAAKKAEERINQIRKEESDGHKAERPRD